MWSCGCTVAELLSRQMYPGQALNPSLHVQPLFNVYGEPLTPQPSNENIFTRAKKNDIVYKELAAIFGTQNQSLRLPPFCFVALFIIVTFLICLLFLQLILIVNNVTVEPEVIGSPSWNDVESIPGISWRKYLRDVKGRGGDLYDRFDHICGRDAVDLLIRMLRFSPNERCSIEEAMNHEYFGGRPVPIFVLANEDTSGIDASDSMTTGDYTNGKDGLNRSKIDNGEVFHDDDDETAPTTVANSMTLNRLEDDGLSTRIVVKGEVSIKEELAKLEATLAEIEKKSIQDSVSSRDELRNIIEQVVNESRRKILQVNDSNYHEINGGGDDGNSRLNNAESSPSTQRCNKRSSVAPFETYDSMDWDPITAKPVKSNNLDALLRSGKAIEMMMGADDLSSEYNHDEDIVFQSDYYHMNDTEVGNAALMSGSGGAAATTPMEKHLCEGRHGEWTPEMGAGAKISSHDVWYEKILLFIH